MAAPSLQDVQLLLQVLEKFPGLVHTINFSYNPLTDASVASLLPYLKVHT